ncbi:MAG TPA: class I SAM-dependent methyltransferase [Candidatus Baltobacteraceae bacterium]|jgi:ubiquinone/menaquinone biosynthesis C-methylase UbiE|nr:class I SAM-dependent methyltransferase [Candidatus Baltobacteraceae bacterium]
MNLIPKEIDAHYQQAKESERLTGPLGELERLRTQAILSRYLPPAPAAIYDVGGAAGVYAFPLAKQGYEVHLIDPVDLHLEQARSQSAASGVKLGSIAQGDARQLETPSGIADAVLLLGPLYHLVEPADRLRALREARRILKPHGVVFAAAISRFASLLAGLAFDTFQDADFRAIVAGDLASGQHRNPTNRIEYFTTAYFHRPEELSAEVRAAGFHNVQLLAVEGPAWSAAQFRKAWENPAQRQSLMEFLSSIEREHSVQGASAHIIALAHASN